jgi:murein DD-endopeptidase MepM/ murein hydrolase activator NlpD
MYAHLGQVSSGLRVFPVGASSTFSRAFSASHLGTDIFSAENAPVVVVESGSARSASDPLGGFVLYLRGDSGWRYYYAHLSGYSGGYPRRVEAGEVVGYLGNTGNAAGGPQHLHFQMTNPQGQVVDPYDHLLQAQRGGSVGRSNLLLPALALGALGAWWYYQRGA